MIESIEELTDKFTSELKTTIKTLKKLKKSIKNAKTLHQNLIDMLIEKDVSFRVKDSQRMDNSFYKMLKHIETSNNYQKQAYMKLSHIQDFTQINKIISDSTEYLNLSFGFIVKALKALKNVRGKK